MSETIKKRIIFKRKKKKGISESFIEKTKLQKPFLKWVGGKTQIISKILSKFPLKMENYHELFLGGGSVLLSILTLEKMGIITINNKIYAYDLNKALINTYKQIKTKPLDVIKELNSLKNEFNKIEKNTEGQRGKPKDISQSTYKNSREHYYYWIRDKFNNGQKNTIQSASYFIFLNKTGFRGMYREGNNGFNIPYGLKDRKTIPSIFNEKEIKEISSLIKDVNFSTMSFKNSILNVKKNDFVYLDPPYAPENEDSFVGYTNDGFSLETHKLLFNKIKEFDGIKFVMSNSKVDLVTKNFKNFKCDDVIARRAINSKKPGSTTTEVIIYN